MREELSTHPEKVFELDTHILSMTKKGKAKNLGRKRTKKGIDRRMNTKEWSVDAESRKESERTDVCIFFPRSIFQRLYTNVCAAYTFLFVFRCTHNIASMQFCCCVVYALKCIDGYFSMQTPTRCARRSHTLWLNRIGWWL